jgi:hypothetical protein
MKKFYENVKAKAYKKVGTTINDIVSFIRDSHREHKFDVVIIDHLGLIRSNSKYSNRYDELGVMMEILNTLAGELNIAIITTVQINREGMKINRTGKQILRSENVADSFKIVQAARTILTINRSATEALEGKLRVCLDKDKRHLEGLIIECQTDFSKKIILDETKGYKILGYDTGPKDEGNGR